MFILRGIGVSDGICIGRARLITNATLSLSDYTHMPESIDAELARFDQAIDTVRAELKELQNSAANLPNEFSMFLMLHRMLLDDALFTGSAREMIEAEGVSAEKSIVIKALNLIEQLDGVEDNYFKERRADVRQIAERVLKALSGAQSWHFDESEEPAILVAHDLFPSDTLLFKHHHNCIGIATDTGGPTSHTAILGRGMNLPTVVGLQNARSLIRENDLIIVNGFDGTLLVNPDSMLIDYYRNLSERFEKKQSRLKAIRFADSVTKDGVSIQLFANMDTPDDIIAVKENGAVGVGLFRSEFLFLEQGTIVDEEEQFIIYRDAAIAMNPAPLTIRTLDLGADKFLDHAIFDTPKNPALGKRGIRFSLSEPVDFLAQLRALLRASIYGKINIMFPMLSCPSEAIKITSLLERAKQSLEEEGLPFDPDIRVGAMIEVPSAALSIGSFAKYFDFFSIGSNDLIQYAIAIDRCNSDVSHLYDPLNIGVLRLLHKAIVDANHYKRSISICGEMASDILFTRLLVGLGIRSFSIHPANLLKVKAQILTINTAKCKKKVNAMLEEDNSDKVEALFEELNEDLDHG